MIPFFSIIIPVYNVEEYLHDCLNSILKQSFKDYEIICINDGSTDKSLEILNEYQKVIPGFIIINQENQGPSSARNKGILEAKGKYILFVDSDDWIADNSLHVIYNAVGDDDMVCFAGIKFVNETSKEIAFSTYVEETLPGWVYYNKYALERNNIHFDCAVSRIYRREFILKHDLFFREGFLHEDSLFTPIACYYANEIKIIPNFLYFYRNREGSITRSRNKNRMLDRIRVANALADFFVPLNDIDKKIIYRIISGLYFGLYNQKVIQKHGLNLYEIADTICWKSFKTVSVYPRHRRIYKLIKIHPRLYFQYVNIENIIKTLFGRNYA